MMNNSWLVVGVYAMLGFLYLVVIPLFLYFWMNSRWYIMGKLERLGIYGLVFLFFPGLILVEYVLLDKPSIYHKVLFLDEVTIRKFYKTYL